MTLPTNTSSSSSSYLPPPAPPAPTTSVWEDFVDIFVSPSEVFARRSKGEFGMAMVILAILSLVLFIAIRSLIAPAMEGEIGRSLAQAAAKNPQMDMAAARAQADKMGFVFGAIGVAVATPIVIAITGVVLWLVGKLVDAKTDVAPAIMVATYAYVPRVLGFVLSGLQGLFMSPDQMNGMARLTLSPARFFDPDTTSRTMIALLSHIDLLIIWETVLLGIGLSVIAKIPRSRGMVAAAIVWALGFLPALLQGAITG